MANDCGTFCKVCFAPLLFTWAEIEEDPIKEQSWRQGLCLDCLGEKPRTADKIKAEYDRLEFDLLKSHRLEIADLCRKHYDAMENLRRQRVAKLAEVEERGSNE